MTKLSATHTHKILQTASITCLLLDIGQRVVSDQADHRKEATGKQKNDHDTTLLRRVRMIPKCIIIKERLLMNNDTPMITVLFSSELVRVKVTLNVNGGYRAGEHLFPFRTESLSPAPPMVLHEGSCGRVGSCRSFC